jgi:GxxExxY protein
MLNNQTEEIGKAIVNAAFKVHKELGPGLLEKVYEICLAHELTKAGYHVARQLDIPIRLDLLVDNLVIAEIKAVDIINPVWESQIISHLKLTHKELGYLINFNVPLIKDGIKRFINTKDYKRTKS